MGTTSCDRLDRLEVKHTERSRHILSWNMAGWMNEFVDPEFITYMQSFDLLCLQETWLTDTTSIHLQGFKIVSCPAVKTGKYGSGSGGVAVLLSCDTQKWI